MKKILAILAAVALAGGFGFLVYRGLNEKVNYDDYDLFSVLPDDNVKGNREAEVLIFEYADYQCPGCGTMWPRLSKIMEEYGDKVGLVYRNFLLSYHKNGTAAASAAEAAAKQGYWAKYADYLFSNQADWENIEATERENVFSGYFLIVSEGTGDMEKFVDDMKSTEVRKKISFDMGAGRKVGVDETPGLYINGEPLEFKGMTEEEFVTATKKKIRELLGEG